MKTFRYYNSVEDFASTLNGSTINTYTKNGRDTETSWSIHHARIESIEKAKRLLRFGDVENAAKIRAAGDIVPPPCEHKPQIRSSVTGCLPNVPNYLRGVPNQMYQIRSNSRKKPVIDMFIEITVADSTDLDKLAKVAAILANSIAAVELAGYRINLNVLYGCQNLKGNICGFCLNIKQADAPLNLLNIAFPLLHPAFSVICGGIWVDKNVKQSIRWGRYRYGCVLRVDDCKREFDLKGIFFSLRQMIRDNETTETVTQKINDYITSM